MATDFCYDFLQFSPDGIMLRLPGGISIEMTKYWDGQPVRFVCCERLQKSERTRRGRGGASCGASSSSLRKGTRTGWGRRGR